MIPFLTSTYLRLGVAVGVVLLIALAGWRVSAWHSAYEALPSVQEALAAEEGCLPPSKCAARVAALEARQEAISQQVVETYEQELADLRNRPAPTAPVRLCRPRPDSGGVRLSGPAPATGASGGAELPLEAGRDIAVELYRLADDADTEALKLRALWARDVALSETPK